MVLSVLDMFFFSCVAAEMYFAKISLLQSGFCSCRIFVSQQVGLQHISFFSKSHNPLFCHVIILSRTSPLLQLVVLRKLADRTKH